MKDWLPWPFGTHYCWFERVLYWTAGPVIAFNVIVIVVALIVKALKALA